VAGWGLAVAAGCFWAGILLAGLLDTPTVGLSAILLGIAVAGLVAGAAGRRGLDRRRFRAGIAAASFVLLGAGWGGLRTAALDASPLAKLAGRSVEVLGTVGDEPRAGTLGWEASIAVAQLEPGARGWPTVLAVHGSVWAEGRGAPPRLDVGDKVVVTGLLERPAGSFGAFLSHRGYPAELSVTTIRLVGPPGGPLLRAADHLRSALRDSFARVFPPREAGLLMGLTLGDTSRLDPIVAERFKATGLTHLLAVSGENVAMFLAPILALAGLLRLGRRATFGLGLLAVGFFVVLTRAEPSVLRAAAMATLAMLGAFVGRPRSAPALMGGAVLLLLAFDPTLVYAIGFQLSVGATAGIAALAGPIAGRLRWMPRSLAMAAGTTLGAQAGVTPLLLHYFGAVPTVTVVANLLAAPAVGPGMLLGLLAAAIGVVWTPGGAMVAAFARIPIGYLEALAGRLARWPLPSLTSSGGGAWRLAAGVAVVVGSAWWIRSGRHLSRRGVLALGAVAALFTAANAFAAGRPHALTVTFFDVGEGDAALVRSPGGAVILIDGGPEAEQVATKLAALRVVRLDAVVATHPHQDHYEGLAAVLARVPTGVVLDTGCRPPESRSPPYVAFLRAVRAAGVPERHPVAGDVFRVGDVRIDVLSPDRCWQGTNSDPNNDSLVLLVSCGADRVLFANEPEAAAQQALLDRHAPIVAPVLNVPHHGAGTSIVPFLQAVHEAVAVVSVGPNSYGHPALATIRALLASGARVFRTDRSGDVTVTFEPGGGVSVESTR
jgi:competence protein ComEC